MSATTDSPNSRLYRWYEARIGPPENTAEVYGYWTFTVGVLVGLAALVAFFLSLGEVRGTDAFWTYREAAFAAGAFGFTLIVLGAVFRFPLRRRARRLGLVGAVVSIGATAWFVVAYPNAWNVETGDQSGTIVVVYAVGIALMVVAAVVVPLVGSRTMARREFQEALDRAAAAEDRATEAEERAERADAERAEAERRETDAEERASAAAERADAAQRRADAAEERAEAADARTADADRRAEAAEERVTAAEDRAAGAENRERAASEAVVDADADRETLERELAAAREDLEELRNSTASFEVTPADDGWVWGLHGAGGTVLATSDRTFETQEAAEEATETVATRAAGAAVVPETDLDAVAAAEGGGPATFVVYEGKGGAGPWRWRLYHDGTVLATSGTGFASRRTARLNAESARSLFTERKGLRLADDVVELLRNRSSDWRWRLRDADGEVVERGGKRYESRSAARRDALAAKR